VQGIRVRGRFAPPPWASKNLPMWVLLDGQGIGHEQGEATKINRAVPPELARKFSSADLICLVDRSVPAMTGDAPILLEHLIVRGIRSVLRSSSRISRMSRPPTWTGQAGRRRCWKA